MKVEEQILQDVVWNVKHRIRRKGKFSKSDVNIVLCESWGLDLDNSALISQFEFSAVLLVVNLCR